MLAAVLTAAFVLVVAASQRLSFVPTLRLDGSAVSWYSALILRSQEDGLMHSVVSRLLSPDQPGLEAGLSLAIVLLGGTFGAFGLALAASGIILRHRMSAMALAFPMIVAVNYLIQGVGLALNARNFGERDELLHRPLVWAYLVVCSWCAAAWYAALFGNEEPRRGRVRWLLAAGALLMLLVPLGFRRGLQTASTWPAFRAYPRYRAVSTRPPGTYAHTARGPTSCRTRSMTRGSWWPVSRSARHLPRSPPLVGQNGAARRNSGNDSDNLPS